MRSASVAGLRAEARRLLARAGSIFDNQVKRDLASRAFEISQRAEALELDLMDPEICRENVERYRFMLDSGKLPHDKVRIVSDLLADAEAVLASRRHSD